MKYSEDYQSSSDSEPSPSYAKPRFLSNTQLQEKRINPSEGFKKAGQDLNIRNKSVITKLYDFTNLRKVKFDNIANQNVSPAPVKGRTLKSLNLKKYSTVRGYQFLVTEDEYEKLSTSSKSSVRINANIFNKIPYHRHVSKKPKGMLDYWTGSDIVRAPIQGVPLLVEVNIQDITTAAVHSFYIESSKVLKVPIRKILKDQRIRWHPDRMTRRYEFTGPVTRVITLISQVINELWLEELNHDRV
ncbi:uncharacterized protein Ecym_5233 [Eremothecium cymbalariae DBVPG|uniref:Uncharacterized protein n=1 Tax=Eremothecium cymbalariae (strain CBS 270.75 / DBVPG 7215 / KCTC 17166 / NRRL Y-17582) TaxID=931890 RepID=I6ND59_ERECY|nr:hypothetical protein Ecym_5233 [Eremothecium cymbalariae DBVPG\